MPIVATSIDERLDALTAQVAAMTAELAQQRVERERRAELGDEATGLMREALPKLAAELERADLSAEELVGLLRAVARTVPDLSAGLSQLSSLAELARTAGPLSRPVLGGLTDRLGELERRGYFDFARSAAGVVDNVVTAFDPEDVEALGDNVVLILNTVKEMTQPEVMQMLQRTMHTVQEVPEPAEPPSLLAIFRELHRPEVRLGLFRVLSALRSVGATPPGAGKDSDQINKEGGPNARRNHWKPGGPRQR